MWRSQEPINVNQSKNFCEKIKLLETPKAYFTKVKQRYLTGQEKNLGMVIKIRYYNGRSAAKLPIQVGGSTTKWFSDELFILRYSLILDEN